MIRRSHLRVVALVLLLLSGPTLVGAAPSPGEPFMSKELHLYGRGDAASGAGCFVCAVGAFALVAGGLPAIVTFALTPGAGVLAAGCALTCANAASSDDGDG